MATTYVLRNLAGSVNFDWMQTSARQLSAQLTHMLDKQTAAFGVKMIRAEVTDI